MLCLSAKTKNRPYDQIILKIDSLKLSYKKTYDNAVFFKRKISVNLI